MTLEERLNGMLEEKEERVAELETEIEQLKQQFDLNKLSWQIHLSFQNDEFNKQMPYPRLEMRMQRLSKDDWYSIEWVYGLVYKHFADQGNDTLLFIPFSQTTSRGGNGTFESRFHDNLLELPFRDGVHICSEGLLLNLPAYIVCKEKNIYQKIEVEKDYSTSLLKMKYNPNSTNP